MAKKLDALIVGGGQAGLAMGRELAERGLDFVILEASPTLASAWRGRWDSLRLYTPARYSALPGLPFPSDRERTPGRDEVVSYLESYARAFRLPLGLDEPVRRVRSLDGRTLEVSTDYARYRTRNVVVATGPFQRPRTPPLAALLPSRVHQIHSSAYRNPDELPDGPVLVVGGGNSGVQIADELARTRPTTLSVGSSLVRLPMRLLGRSIFHWLEASGAMSVPVTSPLGRRASRRELLIGLRPGDLERRGVRLVGRAVGVSGDAVVTENGAAIRAASIVWATGYRSDYPWLCAPVRRADGTVIHRRGVTDVPGLYFLGLSWQHTRGSALLGWVGRDAAWLGERISERLDRRRS
jgi:putative flavoprotein involved in K+ transport